MGKGSAALRNLLRYARFLRGDGLLAAAMLGSLAAGTALGLLAPYLTGLMVNDVKAAAARGARGVGALAGAAAHPLGHLPYLAAAMVAAAVGTGVFGFGRGYLSELLAQHSMFRARSALYEHLQHQSFDFYDAHETGQIPIPFG